MDDTSIISLYFARSEDAINQTSIKYSGYCYAIAYNILLNRQDSEESVNDTFLAAWNTIPPQRPKVLSTYLGKLTRNISLDRWKRLNARKRGGGQVALALEELDEIVSGRETPENAYLNKELMKSVRAFLRSLPAVEQKVFVCRYWYIDSTQEIAKRFGFSQSKVKSILHRIRKKLKTQLEQEGLL